MTTTITNEPELTEACIAFWKRLPDNTVVRPSQTISLRNQRVHALRFLRLLERHGYVKRVRGGYLNMQINLPLESC